ncbi:predicted protein [Pyrenophora tritici-repentis Pt-1C-BFP]|uniref:Uncharacterized protein n=1 Tax=Pyrenophora tritici-repentis (strain Pt-1C-BFP) TaxID=426418 RepID=B2W7M8_PYRTR|nr:uncharacterized protein PTRG_05816 [Pyrenophora tritici-repentis Pt-1C-BFP]EDU48736.1 predicted protein [Pyrenophora tritici-repentis Pt-1C-BFP]
MDLRSEGHAQVAVSMSLLVGPLAHYRFYPRYETQVEILGPPYRPLKKHTRKATMKLREDKKSHPLKIRSTSPIRDVGETGIYFRPQPTLSKPRTWLPAEKPHKSPVASTS